LNASGAKKNILSLLRIEPLYPSRPARSHYTAPAPGALLQRMDTFAVLLLLLLLLLLLFNTRNNIQILADHSEV
jgi:hypothetical protein